MVIVEEVEGGVVVFDDVEVDCCGDYIFVVVFEFGQYVVMFVGDEVGVIKCLVVFYFDVVGGDDWYDV